MMASNTIVSYSGIHGPNKCGYCGNNSSKFTNGIALNFSFNGFRNLLLT